MRENRRKSHFNSRTFAAYAFLIPGLVFFVFSTVVPFFSGIHIAFTDWNGVAKDYSYVGIANFIQMFHDSRLGQPVVNSLLFAGFGVTGNVVVALGTALLVNAVGNKLSKIARTIFFIPVCFSAILSSFIWKFIYKEVFFQLFGIRSLLGMTETVIPAIVLIGLWNNCGVNMLIYLSGLKSIPTELYEVARIDGASRFSIFRKITLPLLTPSFTVCITMSITSWLREFAMAFSATQGGPGGASRTIAMYIFNNLYNYNKAGYGEAIALTFAVFLAIVGTMVSRFFRKREVEL